MFESYKQEICIYLQTVQRLMTRSPLQPVQSVCVCVCVFADDACDQVCGGIRTGEGRDWQAGPYCDRQLLGVLEERPRLRQADVISIAIGSLII